MIRTTHMPMRAYRATTAYAGAHISANTWLWIMISAAVTGVLIALNVMNPHAGIWGHALTLCGMACGTLLMIQGEAGDVSPKLPIEDREEIATPPVSPA